VLEQGKRTEHYKAQQMSNFRGASVVWSCSPHSHLYSGRRKRFFSKRIVGLSQGNKGKEVVPSQHPRRNLSFSLPLMAVSKRHSIKGSMIIAPQSFLLITNSLGMD